MSIASITGRFSYCTSRLFIGILAVALVGVTAGCSSSDAGAAGDVPTTGADTSTTTNAASEDARALLPEAIRDSGVIKAGALLSTPPSVWLEEDGKTLTGMAPDLAAAVGDVLGVKVEWSDMQWPAQLPGVQSGAVDVLWGQIGITPERETSQVDLVAWFGGALAMLVPADNPNDLTNDTDSWCGLRFGVPTGSTHQQTLEGLSKDCESKGEPSIKVMTFPGTKEQLNGMRAGNVDVLFGDYMTMAYAVKSTGDEFATVLTDLPGETKGVAVSKNNPELSEAIAAALKVVVEDGDYAKVLEKYGMSDGALTADQIKINPSTGTPAGQVAK